MEEIPKNQNYQVFFDIWFSTLSLLIKLQSMGVLSTAALHSNRAAGYPLMNDKDLKATGRDSFDYRIDLNSSLHVVKWYDNKGYSQFNIFYGESQLHQEDMGFQKDRPL